MYYIFEVGNKTYNLKLNTRNIVALEKALGCNPLMIFGNGDRVPTVTEMVAILHSAAQQYNHGVSINEAYEIFDAYLDEGHIPTEFIEVILDIYKVSGLIKTEENAEKN